MISYRRDQHGTDELGALLHRGDRVTRAQQQLVDLIEDVLREVAAAGELRGDVPPKELASYRLHALGAICESGVIPSGHDPRRRPGTRGASRYAPVTNYPCS